MIEPLNDPNVKAVYDPEQQLARITYGRLISPEVTSTAYAWMGRSIQQGRTEGLALRGCIFDFSQMENFYPGNITAAKAESRSIRQENTDALQQIPIALIAINDHQRMLVGITLKNSKRDTGTENPFVKLVKNEQEALAFIRSFSE
jgi:hypothetical protein